MEKTVQNKTKQKSCWALGLLWAWKVTLLQTGPVALERKDSVAGPRAKDGGAQGRPGMPGVALSLARGSESW